MPNPIELQVTRGTFLQAPGTDFQALPTARCRVLLWCCPVETTLFLGNASAPAAPWGTATCWLVPSARCWVWPQDAHLCRRVGSANRDGCEEVLSGCKMNVPLVLRHRHASEVQLQQGETRSLSHKALAPSLTTPRGLGRTWQTESNTFTA